MAIASNFPAIRPSLNLDFANAKVLDPRISFSRSSAASYYDGKTVAKAEENLLLNSAILATQSVTTRAEPYTLSFIGTGTVTLSGTSTAGPLVGTGAANRVSLTFTPTAGTLTLTVTGSVEQAQLEARFVATAYTPTTTQPITNYIPALQTAPAGFPRFDHNPVTGESLGLLVEEQRTNLCLQSEDFASSFWQKLGWGVTSNQVTAPDGTLTADLIVGTGGGQINSSPIAAAIGGSYTFSIYLKPANNLGVNTTFLIRNITTSTNIAVVMLNWTSMTVSGPGAITALANGWYRLYVAATSGISAGDSLLVYPTSANAPSHSFYAWGAQLEAGAFPTSYIKTEASQVTRAADSVAMTGANFSSWYRQDEGTLCAEFKVPSTSSCVAGIGADTFQSNLTFNNQQLVRFSAASPSLTLGAAVEGSNKLSAVIKNGDYAATANGQSFSKSSVILAFPPAVTLRIGGAYAGGTAANGTIKRLTYYPKRLTDAQLQALTA